MDPKTQIIFSNLKEYEECKNAYVIDKEVLQQACTPFYKITTLFIVKEKHNLHSLSFNQGKEKHDYYASLASSE